MRALTCWQPWASLVMTRTPEGGCLKPVENRRRPVPSTLPQWGVCPDHGRVPLDFFPDAHIAYDGPEAMQSDPRYPCGPIEPDGPFPFRLGIHAAKKDPDSHPWPRIAYEAIPHGDGLPTGVLLGTVLVTGCHWADDCWKWNPIAPDTGKGGKPIARAGERPGWCSRWAEPDCYHIEVTDPQPLAEPIPMRGYQGWWTLPEDVAAEVAA